MTLERGSVRTEARARSFAYLLPTAPRIALPFNLPTTNSVPRSIRSIRAGSVQTISLSLSLSNERKKERKRRNRGLLSIQCNCGRKGRFSRCYFSTVTDRMGPLPPSIPPRFTKRKKRRFQPRVIYGRWKRVSLVDHGRGPVSAINTI